MCQWPNECPVFFNFSTSIMHKTECFSMFAKSSIIQVDRVSSIGELVHGLIILGEGDQIRYALNLEGLKLI